MRDARLDQLHFLTRLEREGNVTVSGRSLKEPDTQIAMHLLTRGIVNDASTTSWGSYHFQTETGPNSYRNYVESLQWKAVNGLHHGEPVVISSTHAAAVLRAELEQAIQRDRLRDKFGILFEGRYALRDLQMAVWNASPNDPVSVAFLDMNCLKQINDTHGHDAGDAAIRAYSEVVLSAVAERGDAYNVGGDEVVVVLPRMPLETSAKLLASIVRGVGARVVEDSPLSIAAGLTVTIDPNETAAAVRARADELQYRAKDRSRTRMPRIGTLAIDGRPEIEEF